MQTVTFKKLELPKLLETAQRFPREGSLKTSANHLTYLDVDDAYIHQLYPMLEDLKEKIHKPDYFGANLAGAHISLIYPEESTFVRTEDLGQKHAFKIKGAFTADLKLKRYYVLAIEAPSLLALRHQYGLPPQLCFKDHWIDLHITFGALPLAK